MQTRRNCQAPEKDERSKRECVPAICQSCGYYKPQFFTVKGKECAVFTTTKGVKNNRCGAWVKAFPSRVSSGSEKKSTTI